MDVPAPWVVWRSGGISCDMTIDSDGFKRRDDSKIHRHLLSILSYLHCGCSPRAVVGLARLDEMGHRAVKEPSVAS